MKKSLLIIVQFLLLQSAMAQTGAPDFKVEYAVSNNNTANPYKVLQPNGLANAASSGVDYYTGRLNIKIPLWSYIDNDFELPIAVQYTSNGFIPSQESTPVGYNWSLMAGGIITRVVNGEPDDIEMYYGDPAKINPEDALPFGSKIFIKGGYLSAQRNINSSSRDLIETFDDRQKDYKYDKEPDVFSFSAGTHSGKFIVKDKDAGLLLFGDAQYKVYINELKCYNPWKKGFENHTSAITIVSPDGYKYKFGGGREYYDVVNTVSRYTTPNNKTISNYYIAAWHLQEIIAPNGRKVSFGYEQAARNSLVKSKMHIYHLDIREITNSYGTSSVDVTPPLLNDDRETEFKITSDDSRQSRCLTDIIVDGNPIVKFWYRTDNLNRSTLLYYISYLTDNTKTQFWHQTKESFSFLDSLTTSKSEKYKFTYHLDGITLPAPDTYMTDHWGYWNNYNYGSGKRGYIDNLMKNKEPNTALSNVGLLTELTFPTGGSEKYTYTPNTYSVSHKLNALIGQPIQVKHNKVLNCGGARISSIIANDGVKDTNQRTFSYNTGNLSSGVIGMEPKYEFQENFEWIEPSVNSRVKRIVKDRSVTSRSINMDNLYGEYHIGYSDVQEHFSDGSSIHYQFTTWKDSLDQRQGVYRKEVHDDYYSNKNYANGRPRSDSMNCEMSWKFGLFRLSPNTHKRGCIKEKTAYYANNGGLAEHIQYKYTESASGGGAFSPGIKCITSNRYGEMDYYINAGAMLLTQEIKTTRPNPQSANTVQTIKTYTYNQYNQNTEIKEETAGECSVQHFDYVTNYDKSSLSLPMQKLFELNMINHPIGVYSVRNTKLIDGIRYEYNLIDGVPLLVNTYKYSDDKPDNPATGINSYIDLSKYRKVESIINYNNQHRPVVIEDSQTGVQTVVIWGYKGMYPIAVIKNTTLNAVNKAIGVGVADKWADSNPTPSDFKSLASLQTELPNAQTVIYEYKPYVGVSAESDPSGRMTRYEYDSLNRLSKIRDDQGINGNLRQAFSYQIGNNINYIRTDTYTSENDSLAVSDVKFYDGLGSLSQSVGIGASPDGKNIVTPVYYDFMRRESRQYLPYAVQAGSSIYRPEALAEQVNYYNINYGSVSGGYSYAENMFEASPLNRVKATYNVGNVFRTNDKKMTFDFGMNAENEVLRFEADSQGLEMSGFYNANTLYKNTVTNEDGTSTETYKDFLDRVILERVLGGANNEEAFDTYYVYDVFGNLCYVLPPKLSESAVSWASGVIPDSEIKELAYVYKYDGRNRSIEKRLSGADPIYQVYDAGDRVVMSQDGNMRIKNQWIYTQYDALSRPVRQSILMSPENMILSTLRHSFNAATSAHPYNPLDSGFSEVVVLNETLYDLYGQTEPEINTLDQIPVGTNIRGWKFEFPRPKSHPDFLTGGVNSLFLNGLEWISFNHNDGDIAEIYFNMAIMATEEEFECIYSDGWSPYIDDTKIITIKDDRDYIVTKNNLPAGEETNWGFDQISVIPASER